MSLTAITCPGSRKNSLAGRYRFKLFLIMKWMAILLLATAMQVSANGYSQGITLKMKNAPLEQVFRDIEKQSGYRFFYKVSLAETFKPIDIDVSGAGIEKTLELILKNQPLQYEIINKTIVIREKETAPPGIDAPPPRADIRGRITNEQNAPLAGVSVRLKGTSRGTTTNDNGLFELPNVNVTDAVLLITYIGYEDQEIKLNGRTSISVILKIDPQNMEDVTISVSTGIQTMLKGRTTGSFNVLKGDDMNKVAGTDYRDRLEGLVPGLQLGRSSNVIIRGQGTFSANSAPLVVVDGVPVEGADYKLNPDDIDQVTILKDAAAASIWGVRSANGVIVITTKRGNKSGKTSVSYNSFTSLEDKPEFDDLHRLSSGKYAAGEWNKYLQFGTGLLQPYSFVTEIGKIYNDFKLDNDTAKALQQVNAWGSFDNSNQIENLFYRSELVSNHTLSVKTGNAINSHYFSLNYARFEFNQVGNAQDKFNFVSNSDFAISRKIKLQFGTRGNFFNSVINAENAGSVKPYIRILDENGNYVNEHNDVAQDYKDLLQDSGWKDWSYNRLQEQRNNNYKYQSHTYAANLRLIIEPVKGLTYTLQGNYEKSFQKDRNLHNEKSYFTRHYLNLYTENANVLAPEIVQYHLPKNGGILTQGTYESNSYDLRNQLEYAAVFGEFQLNALAGHELYNNSGSGNYNMYFGYNPQTLVHSEIDRSSLKQGVTGYNAVQGGTGLLQTFSSNSEQVERYLSYYSTISLNFRNKYDLFASARLDKTNLLVNADQYRNNPSWSIGSRWNLEKESFLQAPFVDALSVKASYGVSGNIDKSTAPDIIGVAGVSRLGLPVLYITNPENKELGWEKTYVLNLGVEFSLWKKRLSGSIEYYHKNGRELLYDVTLDPTLGWASIKKNAAGILNKGLDIALNGKIISNSNFAWNAGINFSYNYNRVRQVDYTPTQRDIIGEGNPLVGHSLNYLAVIPYLGINNQGDPMIKTVNGKDTLGATDLKNFTAGDYIFAGRKDPPFFGSFINSLQYKAWRLEFFFTYKLGHKFLLPSYQGAIGNSPVNKWSDPGMTWQKAGDENTKPYPRLVNGYFTNDVSYIVTHNQTLVDKADIIRLRTVSLEYSLQQLLKRTIVKDASIRISAENLWFWAANKYDLDTDYVVPSTSSNSSSISFPARKKFVLYLKMTL